MMQISHWSNGALVGRSAPNAAAAVGLGVASHFVLDSVPHYWPEPLPKQTAWVAVDYAVSVAMLAALVCAGRDMTDRSRRRRALWGIAGAAAVDLLLVGLPQGYRSRVGQWHTHRQPHRTAPRWLLTDALVSAASIVALFSRR